MNHQDISRSTAAQGLRSDTAPAGRIAAAARSSVAARSGQPSRPLPRLHGRQLHRTLCREMRRRWHPRHRLSRGRRGARRGGTASAGQSPDSLPEIAFSVEAGVRRQGVGSILFRKLIAEARVEGLPLAADHHRCAKPGDAGARQQVRRASDVPPRRIHRHHRSEGATAARTRKARDRDAGRCRARA